MNTKSKIMAKESFTILIAEDEEINFLLLEEILSDSNLTIIHVVNGEQAVAACNSNPNIDLVLMDIKMPKMDGYTATKIIKETRSDLPVIAQTAYALKNEIKRYEDVFDAYITKPIDTDKLAQLINYHLCKINDL